MLALAKLVVSFLNKKWQCRGLDVSTLGVFVISEHNLHIQHTVLIAVERLLERYSARTVADLKG